ncbi:MAG: CapA family protein [Bacteroidales bacterium]|nr:CapA family protein [Bacteroidales bacterium]
MRQGCLILLLFLAVSGLRGQNLPFGGTLPAPHPLLNRTDTVSVVVIGDVMMHSRQLESDMEPFLQELKPMLQGATLAVANMEFSLGGPPYSGYPAFSAPDSYADYVAACGTDVFLLANNHLPDRGPAGLDRTLGVYASMKDRIRYTGASRDEEEDRAVNPLLLRCKGLLIAFVNATYGSNLSSRGRLRLLNDEGLRELFTRAREAGADYIVALPHWGEEYKLRHNAVQERLARRMVELGADVIVGAHPHVVQDSTHIGRVPVFYSVGNAVSNMSAPNTRLELAVTLRFETNPFTGEHRMLEPRAEFLWCTLPGKLTHSYATVPVAAWTGRRDAWQDPSDYDNMMETLRRVQKTTGIEQ